MFNVTALSLNGVMKRFKRNIELSSFLVCGEIGLISVAFSSLLIDER